MRLFLMSMATGMQRKQAMAATERVHVRQEVGLFRYRGGPGPCKPGPMIAELVPAGSTPCCTALNRCVNSGLYTPGVQRKVGPVNSVRVADERAHDGHPESNTAELPHHVGDTRTWAMSAPSTRERERAERHHQTG